MIPHFNSMAKGLFRSRAAQDMFLKRLSILDSLRYGTECEHLKPIESPESILSKRERKMQKREDYLRGAL